MQYFLKVSEVHWVTFKCKFYEIFMWLFQHNILKIGRKKVAQKQKKKKKRDKKLGFPINCIRGNVLLQLHVKTRRAKPTLAQPHLSWLVNEWHYLHYPGFDTISSHVWSGHFKELSRLINFKKESTFLSCNKQDVRH